MAAAEELPLRDGIVFVVGHSTFQGNTTGAFSGDLIYRETPEMMVQQTLLVGNIDSYSQFHTDTAALELNIWERYKCAFYLPNDKIAEIAFLDKQNIKDISNLNLSKVDEKTRTCAKAFFEKPGLLSKDPWFFAEREWIFSDENPSNPIRNGTILLLHLVQNSEGIIGPQFTKLYTGADEINSGVFRIKKSELFDHIHEKYKLQHILLVDYGCTVCHGISPIVKQEMANGKCMLGGKKRSKIKRTKTRRRKRHHRTKRTV